MKLASCWIAEYPSALVALHRWIHNPIWFFTRSPLTSILLDHLTTWSVLAIDDLQFFSSMHTSAPTIRVDLRRELVLADTPNMLVARQYSRHRALR